MTARPLPAAAALLGVLSCGGCMVGPALGEDSYRGKAQSSVQAALSEVETARLTVELLRRGRVFSAYADETVSADETAAGWAGEAFGAVQPPTESDDVHDEVADLLDETESLLAHTRIATRRNDRDRLGELQEQLRRLADRLREAETRLS